MQQYLWSSSYPASKKLGISQKYLNYLREKGLFRPGLHWKSSPCSQTKPWNPEVIYNIQLCKELLENKSTYKEPDTFAA
tara:strand:+ start:504 stop:740 length:237 start_codon:yes stop_codon:yes gene_type:complete